MDDRQKHLLQVAWKNAPESKIARKQIARSTSPHKATTAKGRLELAKKGR
jgi:hypothetical protein